jgi:hypothetical protein
MVLYSAPPDRAPIGTGPTLGRIGFMLLLTFLLSGCSTETLIAPTATGPRSGAPTLEESLAYASAVYLADVVHTGGSIHWRLRQIWRSDSAVGSPPEIGAEILTDRQQVDHPETDVSDQVVIFIYRPFLHLPNHDDPMPNSQASVVNGEIKAYGISLSQLHLLVTSTPKEAERPATALSAGPSPPR